MEEQNIDTSAEVIRALGVEETRGAIEFLKRCRGRSELSDRFLTFKEKLGIVCEEQGWHNPSELRWFDYSPPEEYVLGVCEVCDTYFARSPLRPEEERQRQEYLRKYEGHLV